MLFLYKRWAKIDKTSRISQYLRETFGPPHSWLVFWNPIINNEQKQGMQKQM